MTDEEAEVLRRGITSAFTPNSPIQLKQFFTGRISHLADIYRTLEVPGLHPILFGDRGIGKTSLANVAGLMAKADDVMFAQHPCNSYSTFSSIFEGLLGSVSYRSEKQSAGFESTPVQVTKTLADSLKGTIKIEDVLHILQQCKDHKIFFIVDEFDRVSSDTSRAFSDLIKSISDLGLNTTLLIVGVADSLSGLIANHPSIERNVAEVKLPVMSKSEIIGIITNGERQCRLHFEDGVKNGIAEFAQGFPYYAHLLSLNAARAALTEKSTRISLEHLRISVIRSHNQVDQTIRNAYSDAVSSTQKTSFREVLYAAANAMADEFGGFSPSDMATVPAKSDGSSFTINALQYPLSKLTTAERGTILTRIGKPRRYRYRFTNPMMRQYVLLRQAAEIHLARV